MKIRNTVFATVGAASLALVLSACGETTGTNNANNKPANTPAPVNTSTPAPINTNVNSGNSNANHGNTNGNMNKPANAMNTNAKPTPTK